ncbi:MAG TPA: hypothetical protein VF711_00605 [Acidimicrobiales bacterium]
MPTKLHGLGVADSERGDRRGDRRGQYTDGTNRTDQDDAIVTPTSRTLSIPADKTVTSTSLPEPAGSHLQRRVTNTAPIACRSSPSSPTSTYSDPWAPGDSRGIEQSNQGLGPRHCEALRHW